MSYRNISPSFWTDSKVDDDFTPEDKYIFLYLLTNPHTNICGCYEISMKQICRETGYNSDTITRLLDRLSKQHDVIRYDVVTKEVLVINWDRYNWTMSEKLKKAVINVSKHIKNQKFKNYVIKKVESGSNIETDTETETVTDTEYRSQIQNTDTETETDTDTDVSIPYGYGIDTVSETEVTKPAAADDEKVPYKKIMELYNTICVHYPSIRDINGKRKQAVSARYKANPDIETFRQLFEKAEQSKFLQGNNDRGFKADFDFMMSPSRFDRLLEGAYDDREQNKPSFDTNEVEKMHTEKYKKLNTNVSYDREAIEQDSIDFYKDI